MCCFLINNISIRLRVKMSTFNFLVYVEKYSQDILQDTASWWDWDYLWNLFTIMLFCRCCFVLYFYVWTTHAHIIQAPTIGMKTHTLLFPELYIYTEKSGLFMLLFHKPFLATALMDYTTNWICFIASSHPPPISLFACPQAPPACICPKEMGLNYSKYNPRQEKVASIRFCHGSFINSSILSPSPSRLAQSKVMFLEVTQHFQVHRAGHMG